jgi:ankyrin repeat protein
VSILQVSLQASVKLDDISAKIDETLDCKKNSVDENFLKKGLNSSEVLKGLISPEELKELLSNVILCNGPLDTPIKILQAIDALIQIYERHENLKNILTLEFIVEILRYAGADVDQTDKHGTTALILAVSDGNFKCIEVLIASGANVRVVDKYDRTALQEAAVIGSMRSMEMLLGAGVDVNSIDRDGLTALHLASRWGHFGCVKFLLDCGANKDAVSNYKRTALHEAAKAGEPECLEVLLKAGADLTVVDGGGHTALDLAIESAHAIHCAQVIVDYYVMRGINIPKDLKSDLIQLGVIESTPGECAVQ